MPNSAHRAPEGPWLRTYALALAVLVVFLISMEVVFRARGMAPATQDTPRYWAHWRAEASDGDRHTVVLAGSSRSLLGLDPQVLHATRPDRRFIQLAIAGATPLPVLASLARDEGFVGTVVVEGFPAALFSRDDKYLARMEGFVRAFEGRSYIEDAEVRLRVALQSSVLITRPEFRPTTFFVTLLTTRSLPVDGYAHMQPSRWTRADYTKRERLEEWTIDPTEILTDLDIERRFDAVESDVRRIESRGGHVIFFRTLTTGRTRRLEREHLPRAAYWDRFIARRFGERAVHFEDFPDLTGFECPDGSHLDYRDVPNYSAAVARVLFP